MQPVVGVVGVGVGPMGVGVGVGPMGVGVGVAPVGVAVAPMVGYVPPMYPGFTGYVGYQYPPCNPKVDAENFHKAFKGLGTKDDVVISLLAHRSKQQLEEISREYKVQSKSHHDLEHALKKELSGNYLKLALLLVTPTWLVKKDALREAVEGVGTRDAMLITILSQATNLELQEFNKDAKLRQNVISDVSGDYKKVVEQLLQGTRPEWGAIAPETAADIAHRFYKAGEGKIGTDEGAYISIILNNSREALHQVNHLYKEKHKHDLKKAIKKETSGNFCKILCALITPRHEYYAERLHKAIAGAGTDERMLNFIFSTLDRGEISAVAQIYKEKYKVSLKDAVKGDTSGCYKDLLLKLID